MSGMSCKDCIEAAAAPRAELTLGGRFSRWFHATLCPPCRAYFKGLAATERVLGALRTGDDHESTTDTDAAREADLIAALRARKRDE